MKKGLTLLLGLLLLPVGVSAQEQADSVPVIIYDRADMVVDITPNGYRGFRGDTITFTAVVTDGPTGDTIPAILRWSESTGSVDIDSISGFATFNNRGRYNIKVEVERILELQIAELTDSGTTTPIGNGGTDHPPLQLLVGETKQLCAYIIGEFGTIIRPEQAEACPYNYRGFPAIPPAEAGGSQLDQLPLPSWTALG